MPTPEERLKRARRAIWNLLVPDGDAERRMTHEQQLEELQDALWGVQLAPPAVQENAPKFSRETSAAGVPCGDTCNPWTCENC